MEVEWPEIIGRSYGSNREDTCYVFAPNNHVIADIYGGLAMPQALC